MRISDWSSDVCSSDLDGLARRAIGHVLGRRAKRFGGVMNPLEQRGMAVEEQLRSWSELNVEPFDKDAVDTYTRTRVILMNGSEVESIMFSHQFARPTDTLDIKRLLAMPLREYAQEAKGDNGQNTVDRPALE